MVWQRGRNIDQWKTIENPEIDLMVFILLYKSNSMEERLCCSNWIGMGKKIKEEPQPTSHTLYKINSNVNCKI